MITIGNAITVTDTNSNTAINTTDTTTNTNTFTTTAIDNTNTNTTNTTTTDNTITTNSTTNNTNTTIIRHLSNDSINDINSNGMKRSDSEFSIGLSKSKSLQNIMNEIGPFCDTGEFIIKTIRISGAIALVTFFIMNYCRKRK